MNPKEDIPQPLKPRVEPAAKIPADALRVSTMRQGVTGVKTKSLLSETNGTATGLA